MGLTDTKIRAVRPGSRVQKVNDGDGLNLFVYPGGARSWRFNYTFAGKRKWLTLGSYPAIPLSEARRMRDRAKGSIERGFDPTADSSDEAGIPTFAKYADAWFRRNASRWSPAVASRNLGRMERHVIPHLGSLTLDEIKPRHVLEALRKAEAKGIGETVRRVRQITSKIFRSAIVEGYCEINPAAEIGDALAPQPKVKHMGRIGAAELPEFFAKLAKYDGEIRTRVALEFVMHTMTRTSEVRFAQWSEIEGDIWRIPAERMKKEREHLVPLTPRSKALLSIAREEAGGSPYVFPSKTRKGMSENTMLYALYRMGYHSRATVHGMRGLASTVLNESGDWHPDWIERQLAHVPDDAVRSAYNAAEYLPHRIKMMTWWSAYLDGQRQLGELLG